MKTKFISILIIALGAFSFFNAKADNNSEVLRLSFQSSDVINLTYAVASKSRPTVNIYDAQKNLLLTEKVVNNYGVARLYNISALPEGRYFFEVVDGKTKTVKSIDYKKALINEPKDLIVEILQTSDRGKLALTCKEVNNKPVFVKIYSKSNGIIFEDFISTKKDFKRVYDLSNLREKEYVFQVESDDRVVTKEVSLENSELSLSK
ncbi:MAG TPA: hypothetical protein VD908_00915 [Cytophagales bacterium]|nr:hypothetical protein [Cytophagales bacterium]